jgi:hypothetical protein
MKAKNNSILATLVLLGTLLFGAAAQAAYVGNLIDFTGGLNTVYATGLAAAYDSNKNQKDNYTWADLGEGDIVVAILKATKVVSPITGPGGVTDDYYTGELTKYLALKVVGKSNNVYTFGAGNTSGWDPFGKLEAGEVLGIWLETSKDFQVNAPIQGSGDRGTDVSWATDTMLFATFRIGDVKGVSLEVFPGLHTLQLNGGFTVQRNPLNLQWLGVPLGSQTFDLVLTGLTFNAVGDNAGSAWDSYGNDAERFRVTPEPGTITALLAMGGAAALGLALRRRKES